MAEKGMGMILRTAAGEASFEEIREEYLLLAEEWAEIAQRAACRKAPALLPGGGQPRRAGSAGSDGRKRRDFYRRPGNLSGAFAGGGAPGADAASPGQKSPCSTPEGWTAIMKRPRPGGYG